MRPIRPASCCSATTRWATRPSAWRVCERRWRHGTGSAARLGSTEPLDRPKVGLAMDDAALDDLRAFLPPLLRALEGLGFVARRLGPTQLAQVLAIVAEPHAALGAARPRLDGWPDELAPARDDVGVFHVDNEPGARGGFSLFVPETYDPGEAHPVVFALHGGAGSGRSFLWSWLRDARAAGAILVAPTAVGETWALQGQDVDSPNLERILGLVEARWNVDPKRRLLTGMSDGGTYSYVSGLVEGSPFTH